MCIFLHNDYLLISNKTDNNFSGYLTDKKNKETTERPEGASKQRLSQNFHPLSHFAKIS